MNVLLEALWAEPVRTVLLVFLCAHPLGSAVLSMSGALAYRLRRGPRRWDVPDREDIARAQREFPVISVLIAAHNEELVIAKAIRRVLALDWPAIDLVVVDDGSTDGTREEVRPFVARGQARLLHKPKNEGKSMALNDGLRLCRGDLVLVLDADGQPAPDALANLAVHFLRPSVGAVTGNPRVLNTRNVLSRLQAIEFSATVGIQRRGDAVWGRLMTVSGLCVLLRRDVTASLGGFAPEMATEDIEMTWRLQLSGYEAMYEARALFGMEVPETLRTWWRQRCLWSLGLSQVLRRLALAALRPRYWRLWPVLIVGCLSIIWAHLVVLSVVLAIAWVALGHPLPELYGTLALFGGDHDHRRCRSGGHGIVDRSRQRPRHRPPAALGTLVSGVLLDSQRGNGAEENTARTDPASAWPFDVDSAP
jgi:biofilm PGA synthesis N-glycosyltransferase PgaC